MTFHSNPIFFLFPCFGNPTNQRGPKSSKCPYQPTVQTSTLPMSLLMFTTRNILYYYHTPFVPKYKSWQRFPLWITYRCIQIHFRVQIHSFCSICSPWWNLYKDLYLGTERVHIKEERKRNMVKKSKQILDNKMFVAQCPHMMNQSALRMQLLAVSRPFQAVG